MHTAQRVSAQSCLKVSKRALLAGCAAGLAWAAAAPAIAQEGEDDTVTVTGSRIVRSGMTTPTPVTTVSATELQTIAPGNIIEVFDVMPQFLSNDSPQTAGNFAGSGGAANLNMRGLNSKRTLVLLDGRRVVSANRLGTTDINVFPEAVIERVEVVTGGASAAYGTDAVAGVTNFILDTDFTGVEAHAQFGTTTEWDNEAFEASVTGGMELGPRGHIIGSFEYYTAAEVRSFKDRDWYEGWGTVTNPSWRSDGSGTGPQFLTVPNVVSTKSTFGGMFYPRSAPAPASGLDYIYFDDTGTPRQFVFSDISARRGTFSQSITNGGSGDNIRADPDRTAEGSLAPEVERTSTYLYLDYDVTPNLTLFGQGIYGTNRVLQRGGATVMEDGWGGTIFVDNAYLPESLRQVMIAEGRTSASFYRNHSSADLAQGSLQQTNKTLSLTGGFNYEFESGGFLSDWLVNGYYQYGHNDNEIRMRQFIRVDRLFLAMDAVRHPSTGEIVCNVTLYDPTSDCIPINLFGAGVASQESIDYVLGGDRPDKMVFADVTQHMAEISANGELFSGFGAGPVSLALGASYREDSFDQVVEPADLVFGMAVPANNPAAGIRGIPPGFAERPVHQFSTVQNIAGSYDVKEVFAETFIPLIANIPMVDRLETTLAARWADYSGSGGIWAWKAGLDWQVYDDLRFRGTVSRDIRAANLSERFDRQGQGSSADDPEFNNERVSFSQTIGGNPNVDPETAETITVGAVYQPSWLEGFGASVDWYDIKLDGAIGQLGTQRIIDDCFEGATEICQLITRDPVTNRILFVDNIFQNINQMRVNGVDVEVSYRTDVSLLGGAEALTMRGLASFLTENSTTNVGASKVDSAGVGSLFDLKITGNVTYTNGPWSVFLQGRYFGEQIRNVNWVEGVDIDDNTVDPVFYTDLNVSYLMERGNGSSWEFFANVQNVFDKEPPLSPTFASGFSGAVQTNESAYDILGRRITAGVRMAF